MQLNSTTKIIFFENSSIHAETVQVGLNTETYTSILNCGLQKTNLQKSKLEVDFDGKLGVLESDFGMK